MDWMEPAGRLVEDIGTPGFPQTLAAGLREIAPYEYTVIFGYVGRARPLDLFDDFPPDRRLMHVDEYQEGPYLLDPFYFASVGDTPPGLWRLREIAPDRFYQGEYYRSYYGQTGLAEEIGFVLDINSRLGIVVSLMRREKQFSNSEFKALKRVLPVVHAACRQHWCELPLEEGVPGSSDHRFR